MNSSNGGIAAQSGIIFQNRVAAWMAVRILAEKDASPLWDLPSDVTLDFLRCETEQPIDDIMVGTSSGGHAFIQAKHSVSRESSPDSALASSIDQFVRQFVTYRDGMRTGSLPWERPLDPARDRFVLAIGPASSSAIQKRLPVILKRIRSLRPEQRIEDASSGSEERKVVDTLIEHLKRSWRGIMGAELTDDDARGILTLLRVQMIDVDEDGDGEREAKDILRRAVLKDPNRSDDAWNSLILACGEYARTRSGAGRMELQEKLRSAGIILGAPRSYREDIVRLRRYSQATARALADFSKIRIGSQQEIKIKRPSTQALLDVAEHESTVVVGDPGAGKSGALHDLVETLQAEDRDVVFFAVDRLEARSLGELRNELGLEHEVEEVLWNWPGEKPAFLVTDALDAARSETAAQTFRSLLTDVVGRSSRWRVIASIRRFDLKYDTHLKRLFNGRARTEFQSGEFWDVCHFNVPLLSAEEMVDACTQSADLRNLFASLVDGKHEQLLNLLRSPFNMRLIGELLGEGILVESLSPITTQIALLDRYWQERVIRNDSSGDVREAVLRRAAESMVEKKSLRVDRADIVTDGGSSKALADLQSSHLLMEWQASPEAIPDRYVLAFAHHVLFDYAVANLSLRGGRRLIDRIESDPELVVAIRPSIVFHFQHEWLRDQARKPFWQSVFLIIRSQVIPEIGKLIGPSVAAELINEVADYQPLVQQLQSVDANLRKLGQEALRFLSGAHLLKLLLSPGVMGGP